MRRLLLSATVVLLLLAGCPRADNAAPPADNGEPVPELALTPADAVTGAKESDELAAGRNRLTARLADPGQPEAAHQTGVRALRRLRDSGWTVFYAYCSFPSFTASAYKTIDGVSYYAELNAHRSQGAGIMVGLEMRAPHSSESTSDLFADRPPLLVEKNSCLERNPTEYVYGSNVAFGPDIELDETGPEPDGTPKPLGHR